MTTLDEFRAGLDYGARAQAVALAMARHGLTLPQVEALGSPFQLLEIDGALLASRKLNPRVARSLHELGLLEGDAGPGALHDLSARGKEIADAISLAYTGLPAVQAIREHRRLSDDDRDARDARRERVNDHAEAVSREIGEEIRHAFRDDDTVRMSQAAYAELCRRAGIAVPAGLLD